jgi:hypothetical protein
MKHRQQNEPTIMGIEDKGATLPSCCDLGFERMNSQHGIRFPESLVRKGALYNRLVRAITDKR